MQRQLEPELMDLPDEVAAYAEADFNASNAQYVAALLHDFGTRLDDIDKPQVIDVGCGPGDITITIAKARPNWRVIGLDASEPMLAVARERAARAGVQNIEFQIEDAKAIARPTRLYDAIVSNSLLHHLPEPAGFWNSIARCVRFGGPMFVRDLRRPANEAEARQIVDRHAGSASELLKAEFFRTLLAAFTADEARAQAESAGLCAFVVEEIEDRYLQIRGGVA